MQTVRLSADHLRTLHAGTMLVSERPAVFEIEGPGAVACLQGLLTNDVEKPGDGSLIYGALLTPKGMIAVDFWVMRHGNAFLLIADRAGLEPARELFRRQLPPRLARVADHSDEWEVAWLVGAGAAELGRSQGCVADLGPGHAALVDGTRGPVWVGRARAASPFAWLVAGPPDAVAPFRSSASTAGAVAGAHDELLAARVLSGFPTLGADIGVRTLPQEVRFDEIEGVSYTKGCYVGQETVARIHFRGHPNWLLRGVVLPPGATGLSETLSLEGRDVGSITTALQVNGAARLALARVRREVQPGTELATDAGPVTIVALPFPPATIELATAAPK